MLARVIDTRSEYAALQRADGEARIRTKRRDEVTVLDQLYQRGCGKIRMPRTYGNWLEAVLINTSGGLTGGDRLLWSASAAPGTHLVVTTQACERVYKSPAGFAEVEARLKVEDGARLDWLPQETILFQDGALERRLDVELGADATFLGVESVILGREAHGEDARAATLHDRWTVRQGGRLIHAEATRLDGGDDGARNNIALLNGARAFGTLCYVGQDSERKLALLKHVFNACPHAGVSRIGDKLVLRVLASSGLHLRTLLMPAIAAMAGAGAVPRLWSF